MSILFCITILTILSIINCQNAIQEYVIERDFFVGIKAPEFTVFDINEKHIYYRMESKFDILQNIKLIAYPSKQEIGQLKANIKLLLYKAEFSILDPQTNQRINGLIEQKFKLNGNLFTIKWGENLITMEQELLSFTNVFRDSNEGKILAQFRIRPASIIWKTKYDMKIFSNKYSEQIYLLGLASYDRIISRKNGR